MLLALVLHDFEHRATVFLLLLLFLAEVRLVDFANELFLPSQVGKSLVGFSQEPLVHVEGALSHANSTKTTEGASATPDARQLAS